MADLAGNTSRSVSIGNGAAAGAHTDCYCQPGALAIVA